jgi:hypothetical protein
MKYCFRVTFKDGVYFEEKNLTKRQAVLRYNKWVREMPVYILPIDEVSGSVM